MRAGIPVTVTPGVLDHHRIGAHPGTASDRDGSQHLRAGPHDDIVGQRGVALAVHLRAGIDRGRDPAQGDAVVERDVVADLSGFADHRAHAVIDEKAPADTGTWMDFYPGQPTAQVGDEAAGQPPAPHPQAVGRTVDQHSVIARVAEQNFQARADRRVARLDRVDVGQNPLEHHDLANDISAASRSADPSMSDRRSGYNFPD